MEKKLKKAVEKAEKKQELAAEQLENVTGGITTVTSAPPAADDPGLDSSLDQGSGAFDGIGGYGDKEKRKP